MSGGVLAGVLVADFSQRSPGPYATMLLADFGADVIMVERPGQPVPNPRVNPLRRNKRSIVVDLKTPGGRQVARRLMERSDVVVHGLRPSTAKRLGLDEESVRAVNPNAVVCAVSGYGQRGPWREIPGHDLNYVSVSGLQSLIGIDGKPVVPFNAIGDFGAGGLLAAFGIMMALYGRAVGRPPGLVDAAMADGALSFAGYAFAQAVWTGNVPGPGEHHLAGAAPFNDTYRCADGKWISLAALEDHFFANLCEALDLPDLTARKWDRESWPAMRRAIAERLAARPRDEWFRILVDADVCAAPVLTLDEVGDAEHFRERGVVGPVGEVDGRPVMQVRPVPLLSGRPGAVRSLGPEPGEHTDEILRWLDLADQASTLREDGVVS